MNFLVLVVQLIMMSENNCSGTTIARSNCPDEFANLNDIIRRQLMQLYSEFVQNVHKNWMRSNAKPIVKSLKLTNLNDN
jgi:hypothetical protein